MRKNKTYEQQKKFYDKNNDYVEFLNNETKEVTFVDIIDEPTEVSSLLVQSAVNEINNKQKHVRVWTSQFMY